MLFHSTSILYKSRLVINLIGFLLRQNDKLDYDNKPNQTCIKIYRTLRIPLHDLICLVWFKITKNVKAKKLK